jgi:hypothetical protein
VYFEKFLAVEIHFRCNVVYPDSSPLWESRFVVGESCDSRPMSFIRGTQYSENAEDLINFRVTLRLVVFIGGRRTREKRSAIGHFREYTSHRPHVDSGGILSGSEKNFRWTIP